MSEERVQAIRTITGTVDGRSVTVQRGDVLPARHAAVRKWPEVFGPVQITRRFAEGVEDATRAPGRKRGQRSSLPA